MIERHLKMNREEREGREENGKCLCNGLANLRPLRFGNRSSANFSSLYFAYFALFAV